MSDVYGPPSPGGRVQIKCRGFHLSIQVDDEQDAKIVELGLALAERRRYPSVNATQARIFQASQSGRESSGSA